jgi:hypothetical protein
MEVLIDKIRNPQAWPAQEEEKQIQLKQKMDSDEWIVRNELVRVWTKILMKYTQPGVPIPPVNEVRRELLEVGVDAAVEAVMDEHWLVFSFMIRDQIEEKVERGLDRFDLEEFVEEVRLAKTNPKLRNELMERIIQYVLHEEF